MYASIDEFCRTYGAENYREFIMLCQDPSLTDEERGRRFGGSVRASKGISSEHSNAFTVTGSCFSRWRAKFTDTYVISKEVILDYLESQYRIERGWVDQQRELIDAERAHLRLIQGRLRRATIETGQRRDSK